MTAVRSKWRLKFDKVMRPPTAVAAAAAPVVAAPVVVPVVGAAVVPVGLAPNRQMEVPAAADVGWYRLGPRPGDNGSAVLAAHNSGRNLNPAA